MNEFKNLKRVVMNELEMLDQAYAGKEQFSEADAKRYDMLTHALKCHLTACAMLKAEHEEEEYGMSGKRGRGMDGRYVSRDYEAGYHDGEMSGHYPYPHYPYTPRNW